MTPQAHEATKAPQGVFRASRPQCGAFPDRSRGHAFARAPRSRPAARAMNFPTLPQRYLLAIAALTILRFIAAAFLPLSADEAYYWLWSRHLAAGYFDHPPAIAFVIRAGTMVLGNTPLGVRFGGLVLSLLASWFVWRSGQILFARLGLRRPCVPLLQSHPDDLGRDAWPRRRTRQRS